MLMVYFELENRTWWQHFGLFIDGQYKCRKKKTAVLARSAGSSMQKRGRTSFQLNSSTGYSRLVLVVVPDSSVDQLAAGAC